MISSQKVNLLGVNIDNISKEEVLAFIDQSLSSGQKAIISNVNLHAINLSYEQDWFRVFLNESQIVFCDGNGVRLGAALTGQKLDYRLTPPDWIDDLCRLVLNQECKMFFLGAKPGISELAAKQLRNAHPGIQIETHDGYFDQTGKQNETVLEQINQSKALLLMVGMGMPLQEKWIKENISRLLHVRIIMPVGALFDYVAKTIYRGPAILTNNGFEWLTRLLIEPKRLWRRYLIGIPVVLFRIVQYSYSNRNRQ